MFAAVFLFTSLAHAQAAQQPATQAQRADTAHARAPAGAQQAAPKVVVTGQVRLRSEDDDRHVLAGDRVYVHLLRTRIRAAARPLAHFAVLAEVQDARYLGQSDPALGRGTTDDAAPELDMHQAWAEIDRPLQLPLDLRFGRQEMSFANERLIGVSNWSNTGRSFDGARATVHAARTLTVDGWADRLAAPSAGPLTAQNFYGAWATWKPVATASADLFALRDDNTARIRRGADAGSRLLQRYTLGGNLRGGIGRVALELEGAGQLGHDAPNDSAARQSIRAFFGSVTGSVGVFQPTQTRVGGLVTVLSGDGSPADRRDEKFNTLFGTNHRLYGTMDYVPELAGDHGLVDVAATVAHVPAPGVRLLLEGHRFLPQRGPAAFGSEADLTAIWRAAGSPFELSGGASAFAPGPLLQPRVGTGTRYWAYISGVWDF